VRFGISTHLYHRQRLTEEHLQELAAHGFDQIELFATRSHFDYHDARAIDALDGWLHRAGLSLHSIHAPIVERIVDAQWIGVLSLASPDEAVRARAASETAAALEVARQIPIKVLVVHLGIPDAEMPAGQSNDARAAHRSLGEICEMAAPLGVRVAVEVIPNRLSSADALTRMLEDDLDFPNAGICLDFGHALLMGDLIDAIEAVSGLLLTTHVHDNLKKDDDHLVPFEGAIDWAAALTSMQKIGYEGTLLFEVANLSTPGAVLDKSRRARQRFEAILNA
jgi:sugar phosphate isomerase/epimerase